MATSYHTTDGCAAANASAFKTQSGKALKAGRLPSHFAFSPKHQNAKLAAPLSSASTGAASNLSRESEAAA